MGEGRKKERGRGRDEEKEEEEYTDHHHGPVRRLWAFAG